eukprot:1148468-Pelagomonas_calceolata.AAC.9
MSFIGLLLQEVRDVFRTSLGMARPIRFCEWRVTDVREQICKSPSDRKRKKKGTRCAPRLGVLFDLAYHIQRYAPAKVKSQLSKCARKEKEPQWLERTVKPL